MRALGLGLLIISVGMIGCGADVRAECEEQVQCRGGNDLDIEACVDVYDVAHDFIVDLGCGDEYDDYLTCSAPLTECRNTPTGQPCMAAADCAGDQSCTDGVCVEPNFGIAPEDREKCEAERNAYASCVNF